MEYPVAEIFHSIQGEGANSGLPMVFVRLAGCTVGKPIPMERKETLGLEIFQTECTTYDGRHFACDTDYRLSSKMTEDAIVEEVKRLAGKTNWVSITGGEPLMHNIFPLVCTLLDAGFETHLETSGTIELAKDLEIDLYNVAHTVVSPKFKFRDEWANKADEIRILIDDGFVWEDLPDSIQEVTDKIWISPINHCNSLKVDNAKRCVEIAKEHNVRISIQLHKLLEVR